MSENKNFFPAYHSTLFALLGDNAQAVNARLGHDLAEGWLKGLEKSPADPESFRAALDELFSGPFRFSDTAELELTGSGASLNVTGCEICKGNEILRGMGKTGACPISQMVKSAMSMSLGGRVSLAGIEKPGTVGTCRIDYSVG